MRTSILLYGIPALTIFETDRLDRVVAGMAKDLKLVGNQYVRDAPFLTQLALLIYPTVVACLGLFPFLYFLPAPYDCHCQEARPPELFNWHCCQLGSSYGRTRPCSKLEGDACSQVLAWSV